MLLGLQPGVPDSAVQPPAAVLRCGCGDTAGLLQVGAVVVVVVVVVVVIVVVVVCWTVAERPSNMLGYLRDGSAQTIVRAAILR